MRMESCEFHRHRIISRYNRAKKEEIEEEIKRHTILGYIHTYTVTLDTQNRYHRLRR